MKPSYIIVLIVSTFLLSCNKPQPHKHLFILSGQSNMAGLNPEESFTPLINEEFGTENVRIVKDAWGGQPIRRWYKDWMPIEGDLPKAQPDLYDSLMTKVYQVIQGEEFESVSFLWMQGERDAREKLGEVYEGSLIGLYNQLCADLERKDINFIIGRLSDFDMDNERYPHWTMIREIQFKVGQSRPHFTWIDTDDLNDGINRNSKEIKNDLHLSAEGYIELGRRFATEAIRIISSKEL